MIRTRTPAVVAGLLLALTSSVHAQRAPLKRGRPVAAARPTCRTTPTPRPATDVQKRGARDLAQRARQSAILGDRVAARDQMRQAVSLDPADPELSYQLARAQEAAGSIDDAVTEYCRFLSLRPTAREAAEARDRVASLGSTAQAAMSDRIYAPFRDGLAAYDAGRMGQAEALFTAAIKLQPDWADAFYDRAQTYVARGSRELAVADLQQYLRLKPEAEDRGAVVSRINALRGSPLSPSTALTVGLVVPGAGQFYTGRKWLGIATLGVTAGTLAYALKTDPVTETYMATGELPFGGGTYTYPATRSVIGHPYLKAGLAGVGAVVLTTAVEAYVFARRVNAREQRVSAALVPDASGLSLRVSLR